MAEEKTKTKSNFPKWERRTLREHCFHYWPPFIWFEDDRGPCHFVRPGDPCKSVCPNWCSWTYGSGEMAWHDLMKDKKYKGALINHKSSGSKEVIQVTGLGVDDGTEVQPEPTRVEPCGSSEDTKQDGILPREVPEVRGEQIQKGGTVGVRDSGDGDKRVGVEDGKGKKQPANPWF